MQMSSQLKCLSWPYKAALNRNYEKIDFSNIVARMCCGKRVHCIQNGGRTTRNMAAGLEPSQSTYYSISCRELVRGPSAVELTLQSIYTTIRRLVLSRLIHFKTCLILMATFLYGQQDIMSRRFRIFYTLLVDYKV